MPEGPHQRCFGFALPTTAWLPCSWAAYVAGAVIVLMRERGMRFAEGLSILISSAVPEGKGVSSSAAVEVATMQALTAAQGLTLDGRDLALLCQKVSFWTGPHLGLMHSMCSCVGTMRALSKALQLYSVVAEGKGCYRLPL